MLSAITVVLLSVFPVLVVTAGLRDATSYIIPNWISLALICAFAPAALAAGLAWPAIGAHAGLGALALFAGMAMFALGWIGGGDAKVFAASALWLGWPASVPFLLVTCVAGGALAVGLLALRTSTLQQVAASGPAWLSRLATPGENVPYGVAIAVGALVAYPQADLMQAVPGLF